jgi:hypothetical protein
MAFKPKDFVQRSLRTSSAIKFWSSIAVCCTSKTRGRRGLTVTVNFDVFREKKHYIIMQEFQRELSIPA